LYFKLGLHHRALDQPNLRPIFGRSPPPK
jgi:hypothetical protein